MLQVQCFFHQSAHMTESWGKFQAQWWVSSSYTSLKWGRLREGPSGASQQSGPTEDRWRPSGARVVWPLGIKSLLPGPEHTKPLSPAEWDGEAFWVTIASLISHCTCLKQNHIIENIRYWKCRQTKTTSTQFKPLFPFLCVQCEF